MVGSIDHGSPDQTILLEATTDVFYIPDDEELGADIATVLNEDFYFGSFSWSDDVLRVTSSLAWNRNCREMLMAFRQACLQQATRANQIALPGLVIFRHQRHVVKLLRMGFFKSAGVPGPKGDEIVRAIQLNS